MSTKRTAESDLLFFFAIQKEHVAIVKELIDAGADTSLPYTTTVENLREFVSQHDNEVIESMNCFLKQNTANQTISITLYEMAQIMKKDELLPLLSRKDKRKSGTTEFTFFTPEHSKKPKNESSSVQKEQSNVFEPKR
ncbi:protein of unknown function [Legionella fallonii LLAP-10]|uniref:Ankyrin repeat protein n=1 Tax=Legionella fallonii LLAP-10 TaxID=1212491 RepID=A0A098G6Z2_9GAMM|nr:protein of unknown function [Legionella fallonii LLAP-10]